MKKMLFIVLMVALLIGCEKKVEYAELPPIMPPELSDCKAYYIHTGGNIHFVMRCPNSTTSTDHQSGKVRKRTVVIDGAEYEEKVK